MADAIETTVTKPAVKSWSLWTGLLTAVLSVQAIAPDLLTSLTPILAPHAVIVATAVLGVAQIFSRLFSDGKPIKGVVTQQE